MSDGRAATADLNAPAPSTADASGPVPWPCAVPSAEEAEAAIAAALAAPVADAGAVVTRTAGELSEIEGSAFDGISIADPVLLKAAAGLRLRLATALATAPQVGDVDDAAAMRLIADADAILESLAQESRQANAAVKDALGHIRTDLVRDAIRLGETYQRLATPTAPHEVQANRPAQAAAPVRLLSNESADAPQAVEKERRSIAIWVVLALVLAAAGGYHLNRSLELKHAMAQAIRVDGAPERVLVEPERNGAQVFFTPPGAPLTDAELKQLAAAQRTRGRIVEERSRGIYVIRKATDGR